MRGSWGGVAVSCCFNDRDGGVAHAVSCGTRHGVLLSCMAIDLGGELDDNKNNQIQFEKILLGFISFRGQKKQVYSGGLWRTTPRSIYPEHHVISDFIRPN